MDDMLLSYYNRELGYLRRMGAEFAERHPKIAGRLRLDEEVVEDPHVSRLIESFAFLTSRIRQRLDDSFPEVAQALMGLLYPDYHAPVPSMAIARMRPTPDLTEPLTVPAGTELTVHGHPAGACRYLTSYTTRVEPLQVVRPRFSGRPFKAPVTPGSAAARGNQAVLALTLEANTGVALGEVAPERLRLFLNGQPQLTFRLHEYLFRHATGIAVARHANDPEPLFLGSDHLRLCGLDEDSAVLPLGGRSLNAHRLLTEYFAFPEKFLFVELAGLQQALQPFEASAEIFIYFDQSHPELVQGVTDGVLVPGCTPVANLFETAIEPLPAAGFGHEARLTVHSRSDPHADVHTVEELQVRRPDGTRVDLLPFYGGRQRTEDNEAGVYWHARREHSSWQKGCVSHGIDTYLSLVDPAFRVTTPEEGWVITGRALCTNRDMPDRLPFGPGEPALRLRKGGAPLTLDCITPPTASIRPQLDDAARWQLVTQLSLQHFAGDDGVQVLRDTLNLYDFGQAPGNRSAIEGITGLRTRPTTARIMRQGRAALAQGTRIELELDEAFYSGSGVYLFTAVLNEFFAQCCTVNSFTELCVRVRQRPGREIQWPPRSGSQPLV